jgi:SAM-dependent methyltransferase
MSRDAILRGVERYYTAKLGAHGPSARGVDWNSPESQELRFDRLLEVVPDAGAVSLIDYGCGYGALAETLAGRRDDFSYQGFDLSEAMIAEAREHLGADERCRFVAADAELAPADYAVASGVFNVRLDNPESEWRSYVEDTIARMAELSGRGFAFNMLTSYSDPEHMRDDLFYGDPCAYFDHCKRYYSKQVALLHDYGLYEFTILVRLEEDA